MGLSISWVGPFRLWGFVGFTREEFKEWLQSQSDIVGYAGAACKCPLANFINRPGSPYGNAVVSPNRIVVTDAGVFVSIAYPEVNPFREVDEIKKEFWWMRQFITMVDASTQSEQPIPRDRALLALEHATR